MRCQWRRRRATTTTAFVHAPNVDAGVLGASRAHAAAAGRARHGSRALCVTSSGARPRHRRPRHRRTRLPSPDAVLATTPPQLGGCADVSQRSVCCTAGVSATERRCIVSASSRRSQTTTGTATDTTRAVRPLRQGQRVLWTVAALWLLLQRARERGRKCATRPH